MTPACPAWESVTGIIVVEDAVPVPAVLEALGAALALAAADSEIVVIANGVSVTGAQQLRDMVEVVPDVTVHFLAKRSDRDTATLLGIDHALGDWIVTLTPTAEEVAQLPLILKQAGPFEVVFAGARLAQDIPSLYRSPARWYFRLYELINGASMDWPAPRVRVYSRAAARYLSSQLDGEFLLRSLDFSGAFPGTRIVLEGLPPSDLRLPTAGGALRKATRGLLSASAVPLRATIGIALLAGMFALLSSLYAVIIYLTKPDVEPGWTTLSLQISMHMFLSSVMFALLAEYVLGVYRSIPPRRRIVVVREIRSPLRRQNKRLNVIGADGQFHLGAPAPGAALASRATGKT